MQDLLHIIVPTFDNPQFLDPCVMSIIKTGILEDKARLFIVNNGNQPIEKTWGGVKKIEILKSGSNLGWEGGLDLALKKSDARFVVFQNDDTFIPPSSCRIYQRLLMHFIDSNVGLVGPATTTASGLQSIYYPYSPTTLTEANWLIFFMVMVRRADLDAVGGIDLELPGGDDFDLSIRMRKANKKVLIDPGAFLIHHGFKTGNRVYGDGLAGSPQGWNSKAMIERTQHALIKKHGFKVFVEHYFKQAVQPTRAQAPKDIEGAMVRELVSGERIVELGCGATKTIPEAVGVDRVPSGEEIPHLQSAMSVADVVADVSEALPFPDFSQDTVVARHILEHCLDSVATLKHWNAVLKTGGRLIIAVPDEQVTAGIPLNNEHCHAFARESLRSLAEACGFKEIHSASTGNGISFVSAFEKIEHVGSRKEPSLV